MYMLLINRRNYTAPEFAKLKRNKLITISMFERANCKKIDIKIPKKM